MIIPYRQRITQDIGTIVYDDQGEGTLLAFDTASDIDDPIEIVLNPDPMEGQFLGITTRRPITDLTITSQYYPVTTPPTSVDPNRPILIYYSSEAGRWLWHP